MLLAGPFETRKCRDLIVIHFIYVHYGQTLCQSDYSAMTFSNLCTCTVTWNAPKQRCGNLPIQKDVRVMAMVADQPPEQSSSRLWLILKCAHSIQPLRTKLNVGIWSSELLKLILVPAPKLVYILKFHHWTKTVSGALMFTSSASSCIRRVRMLPVAQCLGLWVRARTFGARTFAL